jgi:membrane peptidoglycan carboxypeptidase
LAISSFPSFDPNQLDQIWSELVENPDTPLFNRATLGRYHPGTALGPFIMAATIEDGDLPTTLTDQDLKTDDYSITCASQPLDSSWGSLISNGCPHSQTTLGQSLGSQRVLDLYNDLGLYSSPSLRLPTDSSPAPLEFSDQELAYLGLDEVKVNPLQLALAAATLSNGGVRPAPRLATAVNSPVAGWITLPTLSESVRVFSNETADATALGLQATNLPIWQTIAVVPNGPDETVTWYIAGTPPNWGGTPLTLVILLESDDPTTAESIGQEIIQTVIGN